MNYPVKLGRAFYAIALIVYGLQHFYFGTFRNVFVSAYQYHLPALRGFSYFFGFYLVVTAVMILWEWRGREASLLLTAVLAFLFLSTQLTYQFFTEQNKLYHLGLWANQLKEVALCGGAFVVAGSFNRTGTPNQAYVFLEKFIPYGNLLFLFTMICFGICHLFYGTFLMNTIPEWWPDHLFWVHFTGVALISSGVAIALSIRIRVIAFLQALMIFMWVWMMHMPSAIKSPILDRGNLVASAFDALAFSGIALVIAFTMRKQAWVELLEKFGQFSDYSKHSTVSCHEKGLQH